MVIYLCLAFPCFQPPGRNVPFIFQPVQGRVQGAFGNAERSPTLFRNLLHQVIAILVSPFKHRKYHQLDTAFFKHIPLIVKNHNHSLAYNLLFLFWIMETFSLICFILPAAHGQAQDRKAQRAAEKKRLLLINYSS